MSSKIYMYDNGTGIDIPAKIDVYPVSVVLGSTIEEVHKTIDQCQLFCVFTAISSADIIVQTEEDADSLKSVLSFGNKNYEVAVKPTSIWYTPKADKIILFSNKISLSADELSSILRLFIIENEVRLKKTGKAIVEMYNVINIKNSKSLLKTPSYYEAVKVCDKHPCCIIVNRSNDIIHRSEFGKVSSAAHNKEVIKYTGGKSNDASFKLQI